MSFHLVSIDYNGNTASSTSDGLSTMVLGDNMVKVLSWYDNESGYSARCIDLALLMEKRLITSESINFIAIMVITSII